jgi:hypothetical protein
MSDVPSRWGECSNNTSISPPDEFTVISQRQPMAKGDERSLRA